MNFHDALNLILLLCGLLILNRIVRGKNPLEWWHLVSTKSADGIIYFDNDKVGQLTGLIFGTWVICWLTLTVELTPYYFAIWLIYAAGMTAFAKWARALVTDRFGKAPQKSEPDTATVTTTTKTEVKA